MTCLRSFLAGGLLIVAAAGCSKATVASVPANAPAVADEKPLPPPAPFGQGGPAAKSFSPTISK
jgi:hypothetical protein